ncbi:MAG: glyoxal reductase [Clostridia bacterium]|nr:glyoxal reductase [Clostridia bacterium]
MDINSRITLNNRTSIPQFGFGVWQAQNGNEAEQAILWALRAGYRHIDTAAIYGNEESVGKAIRKSGIKREDLFITTKLWNQDMREHKQAQAFEVSLKKLNLDYVDLYLIHWPVAGAFKESWKVMEGIYKSGETKAIGVSNFKKHHMEDLLSDCNVVPAVNQMEFNPLIQDNEILEFCKNKGIAFEAWSPLGSGNLIKNKEIESIGKKYGKTGPQAILRWILQKGIIVFPKSVHEDRIKENADIFNFELSDADMHAFDSMNKNQRSGADPDTFNF